MFVLNSCFRNTKFKQDQDISYDFEVLYRYQGEDMHSDSKTRELLSKDTVFLIIESEFLNRKVEILTRERLLFSGRVSTEQSSGVADVLQIEKREIQEEISIQIDNGPIIRFELIEDDHNIIGIRYYENKVSIVFYKGAPSFY